MTIEEEEGHWNVQVKRSYHFATINYKKNQEEGQKLIDAKLKLRNFEPEEMYNSEK